MIKVMFVCLGNICRSPMAEAVFRKMVKDRGMEELFLVDSCGMSNWHAGDIPHKGTRLILERYGISYEGIYAQKFMKRFLKDFDYIIAMDDENLNDILSYKSADSTADIESLAKYAKAGWTHVPDPWYTGNFDETYALVTEGCGKLLEHILEEKAQSGELSGKI